MNSILGARSSRWTRLVRWALVTGLVALYAWMALSAAHRKAPAFDEVGHLTVGYNNWLYGDFRLDPANGDFPKRWAALPLLILRPIFPPQSDASWRAAEHHIVGFQFLFSLGNEPARLLQWGRFMICLMGVGLGALVYWTAVGLFGPTGGLIALILFVFAPEMLAHGALVTADLAVSFALFASTYLLWRLLHRVTWGVLAASLVAFGLLVPCKLSGIAIFPIAVVLWIVREIRGEPMIWQIGDFGAVRRRGRRTASLAVLSLLHGLAAWGILWAHYDFRYAAAAPGKDLSFQQHPKPTSPPPPAVAAAFRLSRRYHFLPEGFLHGTEEFLAMRERRFAFMNGQWRIGGWRAFFPYAFWVKTPTALLLLIALGAVVWGWRFIWIPEKAPCLYGATPLFALIGVYGLLAIAQNLNIGHRHLLPLYPPLYVLGGAASLFLSTRFLVPKLAVIALLGWYCAASMGIRPDYLAYFNEVSGGARLGYRHLVDSSLDWGMDLPELKRWLEQNNREGRAPVYFAYFGTASPEHYGLSTRRLPGFFDWRPQEVYSLQPGYYAISATLLQGVYLKAFGPWTRSYENAYEQVSRNLDAWNQTAGKPWARSGLLQRFPPSFWTDQLHAWDDLRFARLCSWLRNRRTPDAEVGHSILIWKLDADELHEAFTGPPAELYEPSWEGSPESP